MPFGLRNTVRIFQSFMGEVVRGVHFVFAYLNVLLVGSTSADEPNANIRVIFARLGTYRLVVNRSKCVFVVSGIDFLGHHVTAGDITPVSAKVEAVTNFRQPTSFHKIREFWD